MERSEPALVPEWLKNGGSLTIASHSDDTAPAKLAKNKSFLNGNGRDLGRLSGAERATSSYFRRSSSSNGSGHSRSYSSFGSRNQRDREWEKDPFDSRDKEKSIFGDRKQRDFSERDGLRRSQSMVSGKRGETWPKKSVSDAISHSGVNGSSVLSKGGSMNKVSFERDFPSLGVEERPVTPEIGRVPSPGVSAIQSLPIGTAAMMGSGKLTSALAEVPLIVGSTGISSVKEAVLSSSASVALGATTGLNMAETVAQAPARAQTIPQSSVGTQILEELALKQSRQLIPMTPSLPKTLVSSSSDKLKIKAVQQQHQILSSLTTTHSPRGGPAKTEISKASNLGKLQVLKPVRERNGVHPTSKDNMSPTGDGKVVNTPLNSPHMVSGSAIKGPPNSVVLPVTDRKSILPVPEKRPNSQAKSRSDFFNMMRKKSNGNSSAPNQSAADSSSSSDPGSAVLPSVLEKTEEHESSGAACTLQVSDSSSSVSLNGDGLSEKKGEVTCNIEGCGGQENVSYGRKSPSHDPLPSEEEEAALLRSMGWEENADEGGLTEEEISAFYRDVAKYINSKPLKILQGIQLKFLFDSQIGSISGISSGLGSSDTKLES